MSSRETNRRQTNGLPSFGLVALPLLCCMLGALVMVGSDKPSPAATAEPDASPADRETELSRLRKELPAVKVQIADLEAHLKKLNASVDQLKETQELQRELEEMREKHRRIEKLIAELEKRINEGETIRREAAAFKELTERLEQLRKKVAEFAEDRERQKKLATLTGDYLGPYVLVECLEDSVVSYPDGVRHDAGGDLAALFRQVDEVGFMAIVVRPSSFYTTFPKIREKFDTHYREQKKTRKKPSGFSVIPFEQDESIDEYKPRVIERSRP